VRTDEVAFRARGLARRLLRRALVTGVLVVAASCGISSIAPYNPDGAARSGSGGVPAGTGGSAVASGGTGSVSTGGKGGTSPALGSGGNAPAGSGGQATATGGGQAGTSTGGKGGQVNAATGGNGGQMQGASGGSPGVGTGGASGRGGGPGTGGISGTGGGAPACQEGNQRCSGNGVQTCGGGQWGIVNPCGGTHQICSESAGSASCVCKMDPLCGGAGSICVDAATIASCAQDTDGCFYKTTTVACTTGTCSVAGASPSCCMCLAGKPACALAGSSQVCASSLVCERSAPDVCADAEWAQWPMPNGPAAVASGAPNAMGYTDNGDGTVTDKITGLMWQQTSSGPSTWAQAVAHCPTVTVGGHNDWRLPTRIELLSLVDYSVTVGTTSMINVTFFPSIANAYYWTSTVQASAPSSQACIVNFYQGGSGYVDMGLTSGYAMCVR